MPKLKNQYQNIKRNFENTEFAFNFYSIWVLASIVLLGYFAFYPQIKLIIDKTKTISELEEVNRNMETNVNEMDKVRSGVLRDYAALSYLDTYMPPTYDIEGYLVQLTQAASSAGFSLRNVNANIGTAGDKTTGLILTTRYEGSGSLTDLLKNIESLKRITTIDTVGYNVDPHSSIKGSSSVSILLHIYSME